MGTVACRLRNTTIGTDFSYAGLTFTAKVVDCYDGDTIRVVFFDRGARRQWKVRMLGYNSPEIKPPLSTPDRAAVVESAVRARDVLNEKIYGGIITLECHAFDKYGRILGRVIRHGEDVNEWMLANGYGVRM